MKRIFRILMIAICCMVSCNMVANAGNDKPISVNALPAKGAFYTGKYTNHFKHVLGISQEQVDARMDSLWQHFFTPGDFSRFAQADQSTVYYEVNDSMAFVYDVGSDDVRTEGNVLRHDDLPAARQTKAVRPTLALGQDLHALSRFIALERLFLLAMQGRRHTLRTLERKRRRGLFRYRTLHGSPPMEQPSI